MRELSFIATMGFEKNKEGRMTLRMKRFAIKFKYLRWVYYYFLNIFDFIIFEKDAGFFLIFPIGRGIWFMDFLNEGFSFIQNSHLILFRTKKTGS